MTISIEGLFERGLLDPLTQIKAGQTRLDDDDARQLYVDQLNAGSLLPMPIDLSHRESSRVIEAFEKEVVVVPTGTQTNANKLQKLFERFVPTCGEKGTDTYRNQYARFLEDRGIFVDNTDQYSFDETLRDQLQHHGSVVYFPRGITHNHKLVVEKTPYLPENIESEILSASSWKLLSPKERAYYEKSHFTFIGLSVGFALFEAALGEGAKSLTLADPSSLHADAKGRLGAGYDEHFLDVNKSIFALYYLMRHFPYSHANVFPDGLTVRNSESVFASKRISQAMIEAGGEYVVAEEADGWEGKSETRRATRRLPQNIPWSIYMAGDVDHRVVLNTEKPYDKPFHGYIAKFDPEGDPYGANLPQDSTVLLKKLFGSVGGFGGITMTLLDMMGKQQIGNSPSAEISRVPQRRLATLLSAALFGEAIHLWSEGGIVVPHAIIDLGQMIDAEWDVKSAARLAEDAIQQAMNSATFKHATLG